MTFFRKIAAASSLCAAAGLTLIGPSAPAAAQSNECVAQAWRDCRGSGYLALGYGSLNQCVQWETIYCEQGLPGGLDPVSPLYFKD